MLPIVDVVLDAGHGGRDPGVSTTRSPIVHEKNETLELVLTLKQVLEEKYNLRVALTRSTDTYPQLNSRVAMATRLRAKVFASVHFDIEKPGWRWGCYFGDSAGSRQLATDIAASLDRLNGSVGTWVKSHTASRQGGLYINGFQRGESVLIEFGSIRDVGRDERLALANAVADDIAKAAKK